MKKLIGLIAAPVTPMKENGSIKMEVISDYYNLLKNNGVKGAFINGTTGEGVSQTLAERKDVIKAWCKAVSGDPDFKLVSVVGGTSMKESIELAEFAYGTGIYGVALTAPYYFKAADVQQLAECCSVVGNAVNDIPFYYYHIPSLNGTNFPVLDLLKEVENRMDNFYGVKYTHNDLLDFSNCLNYSGGKYDMLWGKDESLLAALILGAKGAVGSTYNYASPLYNGIIEALKNKDIDEASRLQRKSMELINIIVKFRGKPAEKVFMKLIGLDCGGCRLPLKNLDEKEFNVLKRQAKKIGFESFQSSAIS